MNNTAHKIIEIADRILDGQKIQPDEAEFLLTAQNADLFLLCSMANEIREAYTGNSVDYCSVINGKSGACSQDCAFCAQSARYHTGAEIHPLLSEDELVQLAIRREKDGAVHADIATSGLGYRGDEQDFKTILRAFSRIKKVTNLKLCACLGTLTEDAARQLAACGVERYSINLQTAESYFSKVITTHTYEERVNTILYAKNAGMEVCSGLILGLGETPSQRLELAFKLRNLDVDAVPINILVPVAGTPLAASPALPPLEILKTFAIFRFILPDRNIRYAAGRERSLRTLQPFGLVSGLNGMLIGSCLTVSGADRSTDAEMLQDLGFPDNKN